MSDHPEFSRRDVLKVAGATGAIALAGAAIAEAAETPKKVYRIGVISAAIDGKPQPRNGHTWHFAQYLHPTFDFEAFKKHNAPALDGFQRVYRNPKFNFDQLPFPDTQITHYYDADPAMAVPFTEVFPEVKVAKSLEEMANPGATRSK